MLWRSNRPSATPHADVRSPADPSDVQRPPANWLFWIILRHRSHTPPTPSPWTQSADPAPSESLHSRRSRPKIGSTTEALSSSTWSGSCEDRWRLFRATAMVSTVFGGGAGTIPRQLAHCATRPVTGMAGSTNVTSYGCCAQKEGPCEPMRLNLSPPPAHPVLSRDPSAGCPPPPRCGS